MLPWTMFALPPFQRDQVKFTFGINFLYAFMMQDWETLGVIITFNHFGQLEVIFLVICAKWDYLVLNLYHIAFKHTSNASW